jgi:glyoxylase-like metal-dependent hydrolase (beta-lactamase superfamily II)
MGSVNCYLLQAGDGYVLIDTGAPNARDVLRRELDSLGCQPGTLHLIVLTHGDFDHIGNAAHIRTAFGSRIAMHADDARVAEVGDMFVNRKKSNFILRALIPRLIGFGKSEQFTPDALIKDGSALSEYGLEARAIMIPGHSKGSIGILTADGHFFCGDLFDNTKKPALNALIDDRDTAIRSAAKVSSLRIRTVYPGHGKPFSMDQLSEGRLRVA